MKNIKQIKEHILISMKLLDNKKPESNAIMVFLNHALKETQKVENKITSKNNFRLATQIQQAKEEKQKTLGIGDTVHSLEMLDEMIKQEQQKLKNIQTKKTDVENIDEFLID